MQEAGRDAGRDAGRTAPRALSRRGAERRLARRDAARFELASVRLAWAGPKDGTTWPLDALAEVAATTREAEAARALVALADAGDEDALRRYLRPDPDCTAVSWTVACYRIGDLVPHVMRDFTDPVAAVTTLAGCGEPEHMAAELVASTPRGLCWVALARAGDQLRFQLFGEHSVLSRPGRHALSEDERAAVRTAAARWAAVLASWYRRQGALGLGAEGPGGPLPDDALAGLEELAGLESLRELESPGELGELRELSDREVLAGVAATLERLTDTVAGIAASVERLEQTVAALAASSAQRGRRTPVPRTAAAGDSPGSPGGPEPFGDPSPRWWPPIHRATRRHPAVGGAPAEPL